MKKIVSLLLAVITVSTFLLSVSFSAKAENFYNINLIKGDSVKQSVRFSSYESAGSAGGLSVSTVRNSLFVLKGGDGDHAVLHYYKNLYDTKSTHKIFYFDDKILGHANSMAIDGSYLYITMWSENREEEYKSSIIRISRTAVAKLNSKIKITEKYDKNKEFVHYEKYKDSTGKEKSIEFCRRIIPKSSKSGNPRYKSPILAMTRYKPNSQTENKFLVWYRPEYDKSLKQLAFTTATVNGNKIIVSENEKDIFTVSLKDIKYRINGDNSNKIYTLDYTNTQDIFYDSNYGLYIPLYNSNEGSSYVARINLSDYVNKISNHLIPSYLSKFICDDQRKFDYFSKILNKNSVAKVNSYEIESIAITKYKSKETIEDNIGSRLVLSCNKRGIGTETNENVGGDAYEILYMKKTVGDLYKNF